MDLHQYLRRVHVDEVKDHSLKELTKLQNQHMLHVPFENLDVMHHVVIPLDVEAYYKKVVVNHRGGFCYELNGLFNWLLQKLGFQSYLVSATVNRPDGTWARAGSHACMIVELDKPYLVDIGFGDSARKPLPLTGEIREDVSGAYRVQKVTTQTYDVERKQAGDHNWNTLIRVNTERMELEDFEAACHFNQTSTQAPFTQKEIVTIAAPDGRITLAGNTLIMIRNENKQRFSVSGTEKPSILKKYFHIRL